MAERGLEFYFDVSLLCVNILLPGFDKSTGLRWLAQRQGLELVYILLTHHHADHIGGVSELVKRCGATVFGLFLTCEAAKAAAAKLRRDTQWSVFDVPMGSTELPHTPILRESSSEALSV